MSIFSSLYIGMSGMRTHESAIGVIGNNIANVNTVGYKASRAVFADLLSANVLGTAGASQAGQGAGLQAVQRLVTQGAFLGTNVTTDLAISGNGFFVVEDANGGRYYSRNGQLQVDNEGFLTNLEGMKLQGYQATGDGVFSPQISALDIGERTSPPKATTELDITANLDRDDPIIPSFDPTNASTTSSDSEPITVYDTAGGAHEAVVYFNQVAPGEWQYNVVVPGGELDGQGGTDPIVISSGSLSFDTDGNLVSEAPIADPFTFFGAGEQTLTLDFGEEGAGAASGSHSHAGGGGVEDVVNNGYGVGELQYIEIGTDGVISGHYSNGQDLDLAQLALANFQAPDQLDARGGNLYAETLASGDPAIGVAGGGGRGDILSGSLEQSNVDLTEEFSNLILAQRGFQGSSRVITTADEMLTEVVNLKR